MVKINNKLKTAKIAGALALALGASGCATINGAPLGQSTVFTNNQETCTITKQSSINLILVGGSHTTNEVDDKCARNQLVKMLLTADLSNDPRADADMKALALVLAGMEDADVQREIGRVAEGLPPALRARIEGNVNDYRESLKQQGREEQIAETAPQIADLRNQLQVAAGMTIDMNIPDVCEASQYTAMKSDIEKAYPNATINVSQYDLGLFGLALSDDEAGQKAKLEICDGNLLTVYAQAGLPSNRVSLKESQPFFKMGSDPVVDYLAVRFETATLYRQDRAAALVAQMEQQRLAEIAAAEEAAQRQEQQQQAVATVEEVQPEPVVETDKVETAALSTEAVTPEVTICGTFAYAQQDLTRTYTLNGRNQEVSIQKGQISTYTMCDANNENPKKAFAVVATNSVPELSRAQVALVGVAQDAPQQKGWLANWLPF